MSSSFTMMSAVPLLAAVLCVVVAVSNAQLLRCDPEVACEFKASAGGLQHTFDFRPLCREPDEGDYVLMDKGGHTYKSNICGEATANCLPEGWENEHEFGVSVQFWGDKPPCNMSDPSTMKCTKKATGKPDCCTENCQVLGTGLPEYSLQTPHALNGGVHVKFLAAPPAADDPFWCPYDPATGDQMPRTVKFILECDNEVIGAVPVEALGNATDTCDYTLRFATPYACVDGPRATPSSLPTSSPPPSHNPGGGGGLSGGSIFLIVGSVLSVVYVAGGCFMYQRREHQWGRHVHTGFFVSLFEHASDGIKFVAGCFDKSAVTGASPAMRTGLTGDAPAATTTVAYNQEPAGGSSYMDL